MNKTTLKLLFLIMTVSFGTVKSYGYAEAEQSIQTTVQPSVAIAKQSSSIDTGSINPMTGVSTGLNTVFSIQTNGNDDDYDFVVQATIPVDEGTVSAYGNDGNLLFANIVSSPTAEAIENAKTGGSNNENVIAYPVTIATSEPMTSEFQKNYGLYGDCYVIRINNSSKGTVTHIVGQTPVQGTYSVGQDQAGTYQATVTFTAYSK